MVITPFGRSVTKPPLELMGYCTLDLIFKDFVYLLKKIKHLWTKYTMDLIRNVPRNSKYFPYFD